MINLKLNAPNVLTLARVAMIPAFLIILTPGVVSDQGAARIAALAIFIVASLTDLIDGYIARRFDKITTFGKFADPLADKLLVSSALIVLTGLGDLPAWVSALIISREFIVTGLRLVAVGKGVVISASIWGKLKTTSQMLMIIALIPKFANPVIAAAGTFLIMLATALTIISMIDYLAKYWKLIND